MFDQAKLERARALSRPTNLSRGGAGATWYAIRNDGGTAEMRIFDEIGYWGVTADQFVRDLADLDATDITLRINSPGGDVFDGIAIYNALATHPANITVMVDGLAASAASFIAMAGKKVNILRNARIMIHDASGVAVGNAAVMEEMRALLDDASNNIADIYSQKAGGEVADWRAAMQKTTWYSAQEAVDAGLADSLVEPVPAGPEDKAAVISAAVENTDSDIDFESLLRGVDLGAIMKESR